MAPIQPFLPILGYDYQYFFTGLWIHIKVELNDRLIIFRLQKRMVKMKTALKNKRNCFNISYTKITSLYFWLQLIKWKAIPKIKSTTKLSSIRFYDHARILKQYLQRKHVGKLFAEAPGKPHRLKWISYQAKILNPALYLLFSLTYSILYLS